MNEEDMETGRFRGDTDRRLMQLEADMKTLHARIWFGIVAIGAVAAAPYIDIIQALLTTGGVR